LLTLKARRLLHEADVVIHDRLVPAAILELARREALILEVGKTAYGPSWKQADIDALIVAHAAAGAVVVRLKGGDPVVFGRLDEEIAAVEAAGIGYGIVPGVTSASASAAAIGQSLTKRGRNSSFRVLTGHDVDGFAEQEWRDLAKPGATAAVYMGGKAATFLRGRLLMHGARSATPVTVVESASRPAQRVIATTLIDLPAALAKAAASGPVMILIGLAPRAAATAAIQLRQAL
jgi:uroporphyrin-III C-methyltransferase/precorrin-2 dehydrogenase/sirohydrochlorin ferrochelatase